MSCNGCRVLRKGCSDTCILRQCLRWIESPDAQGHATVFVAKFFGRAGMMALISSVPESQRPALFQSLLYEACGRTINPVFGAVGLLCSGNWKLCQEAVETVMKGGLLAGSPSSGTGRPFQSPTAKLRLGRTLVNPGQLGQPPLTQQLAMKHKEEEVAEDEDAFKNTIRMGMKRKANEVTERPSEYCSNYSSYGGGRGKDEVEEAGKKKMKVEEGQEYEEKLACAEEGPGLDLTLGSSLLSCSSSGWNKRGGQAATSSSRRRRGAVAAAAATSSNCSSRSCHDSEADSDTTDLSISMRHHSSYSSSTTLRRELLLDLLH